MSKIPPETKKVLDFWFGSEGAVRAEWFRKDGAFDAEILRRFGTLIDKADPASRSNLDYAHRHRVIIERFGRFPHRNAAWGRESTPQEVEFLKQPGSGF